MIYQNISSCEQPIRLIAAVVPYGINAYVTPEQTKSSESDLALLNRVRSRDETAMAALYDKYKRLVYTVSLRVLGDPQAAEDLSQDVFMRVWRNPDMQVPPSGMAPWFAVVARNRSIDVLRQRKNFVDVDATVLENELGFAPDFDQERLIQQARQAMQNVSPEQREALQMAFFEGLTHVEIAERTGLPLGTIKTRIRSAVTTLRKVMIT
jgi:RNA polymerase sigma-70 factor (ECF subfamily)